jgi:(R,R)-butanediol dehydrogenase/meso-butanediol dehydrogenase/diacetyl reductase
VRALRFHGPGDLRIDEVPEPAAVAGTVKIRVAACGICGSDVHEYLHGPRVLPTPERPHPLTGEAVPLTLGHEFSGEVVQVGAGVEGFPAGTPVAVEPLLSCGRCPPCRRGDEHLCEIGGAVGLSGRGGGFAEHVVVDVKRVHRLPAGMDLEVAALVEPLAVGWHAVRRSGCRVGDAVLVIGAGPVGLGCLASARAAGARCVVTCVRRAGVRAELARALGADAVVRDAAGAVSHAPGGFDVVLDTGGNAAALRTALAAVRRGGVVVDVALWLERAELNLNKLLAREIALVGSMAYAGEYPAVMAAAADGRMGEIERMITARVTLHDAVVDGFEALARRDGEHVKVLVRP